MTSPKKTRAKTAQQPTAQHRQKVPAQALPDFDHDAFKVALEQAGVSAKALRKHVTAIADFADSTGDRDLLELLAISDDSRLRTPLEEYAAAVRQLNDHTSELRSQLDLWQSSERRTRRLRFENIASQMEWRIVGSWPEPVVQGIVFVVVDDAKNRAIVNGRPVVPPTAERLAEIVATELAELVAARLEPVDFIGQIWRAYTESGCSPGQGITVQDLLPRLVWQRQTKAFHRDPRPEMFRGYPMAQFRADLTHYLASGAPAVRQGSDSYDLDIVGGSFAQDGIFMYFPQSDRLATCGRLTFRPQTRGGAS